ncbi:hypothetical protein [Rhodococcus erythropolis]|uniref:hypothetical protein n=1 Tax=Rhodococcus erythropolis TaxID=1833 RepID=UPI001BE5C05D|nr:hypothetical protein [Rhodococcus erythropolis]MBT2269798.1 hypothetical protein [Rhodococcus erythropolis]
MPKPPNFLVDWAPVIGPIATTLAVAVSLFVVFRDFHWKRSERLAIAQGQAASVLISVKKDQLGKAESYKVQNQGTGPIFDFRLFSLTPDGARQQFAITKSDHRFIQVLPPSAEKTLDAADGATSLDDPELSSIVAAVWRDLNGQNWGRLGRHEPFRIKERRAESELETKRAALIRRASKASKS